MRDHEMALAKALDIVDEEFAISIRDTIKAGLFGLPPEEFKNRVTARLQNRDVIIGVMQAAFGPKA